MDEVIFLEVLEGDVVQARHRLERFPATVGRGYTNDVILDDPKVSAEHLRIERAEDGTLRVRDVGSHNGTYRLEPWARLAEMALAPDSLVSVGDTVLRFRPRSFVVPDTAIAAAPAAPRVRLFEQPRVFPGALLTLLGASLLHEHFTNYGRTDWGELTVAAVVPLVLTLMWAGGWSVASRIARRQFHYRVHAAIGSLMLLGMVVSSPLLTLLGFSLSLGSVKPWLEYAVLLGLPCWGLYWHLRYVTRWEPRRLARVLVAVTLLFGGLTHADDLLGNENFSDRLEFSRSLLPPVFRLARPHSMDSFFDEAPRLQQKVDALAKED